MATTSAFGWETPDDTDLVKDGAAAIRTLGNSIDSSLAELKGGTTGQVLSKTSATDMDFTWSTPAVTSGPAFSAYLTGTQTLTSGVATKIAYNTEQFDTDNNFDPTTNYRFTPTKAGYYQISVSFYISCTSNTRTFCRVYKNGASINVLFDFFPSTTVTQLTNFGGSALVYLNGTTDYLEIYSLATGTGLDVQGATSGQNIFSGVWIRS